MRRIVLAASILLCTRAFPLSAQTTDVKWSGGRLTVEARNVNLSELLDQIHAKTGMRVIYDGPAPTQRFDLSVAGETPVTALTALLKRQNLKFAMVLGNEGTQVETLLVSTAQPPPPPPPSYSGPAAFPEAPTETYDDVEIPMDESQMPPMPEPMGATGPTGAPATAAVMPTTAPPSMASPFTPQGPGPVIFPLPGATPTPDPSAPQPAMTPLPGSTAELPPWEKRR